ncbi:MAG: hypothetical protein ABW007_02220 [Chitinophagaceae bacterium]
MNNYIGTLVERSIGTKPAIQPRITGKFEARRNFAGDVPQDEFPADTTAASRGNDIGEPSLELHEKGGDKKTDQKNGSMREEALPASAGQTNIHSETIPHPSITEDKLIAPAENSVNKFEQDMLTTTSTDTKESSFSSFLYTAQDPVADPETGSNNILRSQVAFTTATDPVNSDQPVAGQQRKAFVDFSGDPEIFPPENLREDVHQDDTAAHHRLDAGTLKMQDSPFPEQQASGTTKTVNVHIGRIEVRVFQPPAENRQKPKKQAGAGVEEFLNKRNGMHK